MFVEYKCCFSLFCLFYFRCRWISLSLSLSDGFWFVFPLCLFWSRFFSLSVGLFLIIILSIRKCNFPIRFRLLFYGTFKLHRISPSSAYGKVLWMDETLTSFVTNMVGNEKLCCCFIFIARRNKVVSGENVSSWLHSGVARKTAFYAPNTKRTIYNRFLLYSSVCYSV